jgi:hypothetical protein
MPTYDYGCKVCSKVFEAEQSIKDEAVAECPVCKIYCHNRLISSGTSFTLKGDGWASDNYSKKSK